MKINVTKLHICQRCPRLFAYSEKGDKNIWKVGLKGSGNLPGTKFHNIAARFHKDASGNGDAQKKEKLNKTLSCRPEMIKPSLIGFLRDEYFIPDLCDNSSLLSEKQIMALAMGVEIWGDYLAEFLIPLLSGENDVEKTVNSVFQNAEVMLKAEHLFEGGNKLMVSGKPDALMFDIKNNDAVVLEFKGRKISDQVEDFAQTILYAWLVSSYTGIIPRVEILYLEEEEPLASYSSDAVSGAINNLSTLFEVASNVIQKRLPVPRTTDKTLCAVCPFKDVCELDFGEQDINKSEKEEKPENGEEATKRMHELVEVLSCLKLPVKSDGHIKGPRFIRLKIIPDFSKGVTVSKLINKAEDLQVALGLEAPPLIQPQSGYVSVDIPRKEHEVLTLKTVLQKGQNTKPDSDAAFPLGVGIDGGVFWADLADSAMPSILIGGTSGSGKSELLRSIVTGLALSAPQGSVKFTLIDPKRVSFTDFSEFSCLEGPVLMDGGQVIPSLERIVRDMEDRYKLFEESRVHDIVSYNKQEKVPLFRRVVVIDEYADLITSKDTKEGLETAIQRIGQKGRAAGIHLILATQRPDSKVITGLIKANLQLKISLKVTSSTNSKIILDETGGEYLIGHGDMLVGGSISIERLQGALVTEAEIEKLLSA